MATARMARTLENIYYDVRNPASFGGASKLAKESKTSLKNTQHWLSTQDTYTLHKPVKRNFKRRKVLSFGINELIQCDLVDMSKLSRYNKGVKYLLTAIDVFSKFAYVIPLKNKTASSVEESIKKLLRKAKNVINIQTDEGKEFLNRKVQTLFKKHLINHYYSHSEFKASVVERFNRTLKTKLYRIFTHRNSYRYLDVLPNVVKSYNASIHRSTGFTPVEVNSDLEPIIFEKLYGYQPRVRFRFKEGDQVRISRVKKTFHKGYFPNWTEEIFTVFKRFPTDPPTYLLSDVKQYVLKGRFYESELQKVLKTLQDYWRVEKILKSHGKGVNRKLFVKFLGYKDPEWIPASWMK